MDTDNQNLIKNIISEDKELQKTCESYLLLNQAIAREIALKLAGMFTARAKIKAYFLFKEIGVIEDIDLLIEKFSSENINNKALIIIALNAIITRYKPLDKDLNDKIIKLYNQALNENDTFIYGHTAKGLFEILGKNAINIVSGLFDKNDNWINEQIAESASKYMENSDIDYFKILIKGFNDKKNRGSYLKKLIPAIKKISDLHLEKKYYNEIIDSLKYLDTGKDADELMELIKALSKVKSENTENFKEMLYIIKGISKNELLKTVCQAVIEKTGEPEEILKLKSNENKTNTNQNNNVNNSWSARRPDAAK